MRSQQYKNKKRKIQEKQARMNEKIKNKNKRGAGGWGSREPAMETEHIENTAAVTPRAFVCVPESNLVPSVEVPLIC